MIFALLTMGVLGPILTVWIWRQALSRLQAKSRDGHFALKIVRNDDNEIEQVAGELSPLANAARLKHTLAKDAQRQYQDLISSAIGMVFFAFLVFACEVSFESIYPNVPRVAYSLEFILLVCSIFAFLAARRKLSVWMRARTDAEILRQRYYCALMSGSLDSVHFDSDSIDAWLKSLTTNSSGTDLNTLQYAIASMEDNIALAQGEDGMPDESVKKLYLEKRVERQIHWFEHAEDRQVRFLHIRERVLLTFFGLAILVALLKASHYLLGIVPLYKEVAPFLTLVSMVSLASTALLAALLLSQNSGYLRLRYKKQAAWITNEFSEVSPEDLTTEMIVKFEKSILKELLDFLEVFDVNSPEISL